MKEKEPKGFVADMKDFLFHGGWVIVVMFIGAFVAFIAMIIQTEGERNTPHSLVCGLPGDTPKTIWEPGPFIGADVHGGRVSYYRAGSVYVPPQGYICTRYRHSSRE